MNQSRLTPPEKNPMVARPNTPLSPFRRDAVGGSAPALSYIANRRDGSPMFSLSPFQLSSPVKNVSGRESASSSGRSQTPQRVIKPIRETPPIKSPLSSSVSNHKLRTNSSTQISDQFYQYMPSKSYGAINEQHIYDGVDVDQCHRSAFIRPEAVKESPKCESLSKSSSDGDHIINKKKVLTKSKTRRRNILCLATPATVVSDDSINANEISGRVRQGCYGGSSSDDNRYSAQGMSDNQRSSYISSSPTYDTTSKLAQLINAEHMSVPNMSSAVNQSISSSNTRHSNLRKSGLKARKREQKSIFQNHTNGGQLEGVRAAIEQMSLRTQGSHSTSTYSSNISSSDYSSANPSLRRLIRHSSLETIGTNITSAGDEFVWIDSDCRLVELQHYPWTNGDVLRLLQQGRLKNQLMRISMECVPRLSHLLQRPLIRIACEAQRFAKTLGLCTRHEVCGAIKVVLSASLADSSIKCGHRAAAIFAVSGPDNYRQSKSVRAGLCLSLGKFHRWMCDVRIGQFIDEYAAIYLLSAMENLFEEIIVQCLSVQIEGNDYILSSQLLDSCIANNSDFWGLLQPFAHLNAGRTATGMLSLPSLYSKNTANDSTGSDQNKSNSQYLATKTLEQQLLTTCVGSVKELGEIIENLSQHSVANGESATNSCANWWSTYLFDSSALHSLYYYMRCTQLEHNSVDDQLIQRSEQLIKERSYVVLPPLYEWIRVSAAHTYYRRSNIIDQNDVLQAARILLPGIDCPPRQSIPINIEEWIIERKDLDPNECNRRLKMWLAFRMLSVGRSDLLSSALQLLPNHSGLNAVNDSGLTILMHSCIVGDTALVQCLCESGANVNIETPVLRNVKNKNKTQFMSETQYWTALNYATINGHIDCVKILLEKGANVDGGYRYGDERVTQTPLQLASSSGRIDLVRLLLSYGADPFLHTTLSDSIVTHCSQSRGCPSAIAVAAIHGHRMVLRTLLAHPTALSDTGKERLSLEEMLAESSANYNSLCANKDRNTGAHNSSDGNETSNVIQWTKSKIKALQEAMYHSAENENIEITLDLTNIGVPWTLHTWMQTLATSHEMRLEAITDQLLQDFLQLWPDDCSSQFIDECLPLLFSIFRHSKHNSTTALLLADIFSTCFGSSGVEPITTKVSDIRCFARIDAKYVNNREMSDCVFRVENRVFYAHKIILVNASKRFQSMLSTNNYSNCDDNSNDSQTLSQQIMTPIVIDNIRYDIFLKVMQFLYNGGFDEDFEVDQKDILELLSAAAYFELEGLVRYCSVLCSQWVTLNNIISYYMNAIRYKATELRQFCQTFILHHLVALLSYETPLSELLFKTKADNNRNPDLLSALLFTLQNALRVRQTPPKNHFNMKANKNQSVL